MKVSIDQAACQGDCICEVICPQVFVLDETGIAWVAESGAVLAVGGPDTFASVPGELEDDVRDAVVQCPTQCMRVQDG